MIVVFFYYGEYIQYILILGFWPFQYNVVGLIEVSILVC